MLQRHFNSISRKKTNEQINWLTAQQLQSWSTKYMRSVADNSMLLLPQLLILYQYYVILTDWLEISTHKIKRSGRT